MVPHEEQLAAPPALDDDPRPLELLLHLVSRIHARLGDHCRVHGRVPRDHAGRVTASIPVRWQTEHRATDGQGCTSISPRDVVASRAKPPARVWKTCFMIP